MHGLELHIPAPRAMPPGFVNAEKAAQELGCLPSELPEKARGVETRRRSGGGVLFSLSGLEQVASRPFAKQRRFVRLSVAAKRAGVDTRDLEQAVLGRIELRAVGRDLEADREQLAEILPELERKGLIRPKPKGSAEATPAKPQGQIVSSNRKRRPRLGAPQPWSARPWAR